MARLSRFSIARTDIIKEFDSHNQIYYTSAELSEIFNKYRENWRLTKSMRLDDFLKELTSKTLFKKISMTFPGRNYVRYVYRNFSFFALATQISSKSYLSHYTAASLHGLTEQLPKRIYVTDEQAPKKNMPHTLTQQGIDIAFQNPSRVSNSVSPADNYQIHLLKGKNTNSLGVITMRVDGVEVRVTNLERTLIDLVVRPSYSGGVAEVLKAYEQARERVSVNTLAAMLSKLDFIYPYGQAIGFYMQRAGYRESLLALFRQEVSEFDFYLANEIVTRAYDPYWKIWYPKDLNDLK